jgi:small ubiquitin-related modifier
MSNENENGTPGEQAPANSEHLNIKVTDNNNEVFFKIKRTTKLEKLMGAFCERQGKATSSVRFLFDGTRVQPTDTPDAVRFIYSAGARGRIPQTCKLRLHVKLSRKRSHVLTYSLQSSRCKTATLWKSTRSRWADFHSYWGKGLGGSFTRRNISTEANTSRNALLN